MYEEACALRSRLIEYAIAVGCWMFYGRAAERAGITGGIELGLSSAAETIRFLSHAERIDDLCMAWSVAGEQANSRRQSWSTRPFSANRSGVPACRRSWVYHLAGAGKKVGWLVACPSRARAREGSRTHRQSSDDSSVTSVPITPTSLS
jgi:hypothetical protein